MGLSKFLDRGYKPDDIYTYYILNEVDNHILFDMEIEYMISKLRGIYLSKEEYIKYETDYDWRELRFYIDVDGGYLSEEVPY